MGAALRKRQSCIPYRYVFVTTRAVTHSIDVLDHVVKGKRFLPPFYGTNALVLLTRAEFDARRPMCGSSRLSGKSDEGVDEDARRKPVNTGENAQRSEILPVDTPSAAEARPTSDVPNDPPKDPSYVLPTHLSKLHPLSLRRDVEWRDSRLLHPPYPRLGLSPLPAIQTRLRLVPPINMAAESLDDQR